MRGKYLLVVVLLSLCVNTLFAQHAAVRKSGPFGFERGMTKEQVIKILGRKAIQNEGTDNLRFNTAPKPHDDFASYDLIFSRKYGLEIVTAFSKQFDRGTELKDEYSRIKTALNSIYGVQADLEVDLVGTAWVVKPPNFGRINFIALTMLTDKTKETGMLSLVYTFEGSSENLKQEEANRNSVF